MHAQGERGDTGGGGWRDDILVARFASRKRNTADLFTFFEKSDQAAHQVINSEA